MAEISVVVVAFRRPNDLAELKGCLEKQTVPFELNIIDDSETDYGLSFSRNLGINKSKGDLIIFLDDDVLCPPDLVERFLRSFSGGADIVGAYVSPLYLGEKPWWFDEGRNSGAIGACNNGIIGACFGVRRRVFASIGGFREDLGRRGGTLLSGEEVEFLRRAELAGFTSKFDPSISVLHKVPQARLTMSYLIRRNWYEGKSEAIMR